jgi:hypothetical protein
MINQFKKYLPIVLLVSVVFLTGCSKRNQRIINNLNNRPNDFEQTQNGVTVSGKFLTKDEFRASFNNATTTFRRKKLLKNYKATQIKILNTTDKNILLKKDSFNFDTISREKLLWHLKSNPMNFNLLVDACCWLFIAGVNAFTTPALIVASITTGLFIPFDVIRINQINKRIDSQVKKLAYDPKTEVLVKPFDFFTTIIIPENTNIKEAGFQVTLFDSKAEKNIFNFNLAQPK